MSPCPFPRMWETTGGATSRRLPTSTAAGRPTGGRGTTGVPPGPAARRAAKTASSCPAGWRAGPGTPTSGRHSGPQGRGGAAPNRRDGSLLGAYPTGQSGAQARERRPPVGTAARRAAAAPPPTVGMVPFSARTPPGRAARRPGNADLRSARPPRPSGLSPSPRRPTGPRRRRPQPSGWLPSRRVPHRAEQHAGKGTPTSGRHRCAKRSERRVPRSRPDDAERRGPGREANHPELGVLPCRPPEAGERRTLDGPDGPPAPVHFREGHACRHPARRSTT